MKFQTNPVGNRTQYYFLESRCAGGNCMRYIKAAYLFGNYGTVYPVCYDIGYVVHKDRKLVDKHGTVQLFSGIYLISD